MPSQPIRTEHFEFDALPVTAWKNGGGSTREIARVPRGAALDAFDWRVSIAELSESGPFSSFPGVDRIITLLDGDGVRMIARDGSIDHMLDQRLEPFDFAGEPAIDATLIGGASCDFNVMTRRATTHAHLRIVRAEDEVEGELDEADGGVLYVVRGEWRVTDQRGESHTLRENEGVWWSGRSLAWTLLPDDEDAALIAVGVHNRS